MPGIGSRVVEDTSNDISERILCVGFSEKRLFRVLVRNGLFWFLSMSGYMQENLEIHSFFTVPSLAIFGGIQYNNLIIRNSV